MAKRIKPTFDWYNSNAGTHVFIDNRGGDTIAEWFSIYGETVTQDQIGTEQYPYKTISQALSDNNNVETNFETNGSFSEILTTSTTAFHKIYGYGRTTLFLDGVSSYIDAGSVYTYYYGIVVECGGNSGCFVVTSGHITFDESVINNAVVSKQRLRTYNTIINNCSGTFSIDGGVLGTYTQANILNHNTFINCDFGLMCYTNWVVSGQLFVNCQITTYGTGIVAYSTFYNTTLNGLPIEQNNDETYYKYPRYITENPLNGDMFGTLKHGGLALVTDETVGYTGAFGVEAHTLTPNTLTPTLTNIIDDNGTLRIDQWEKTAQAGTSTSITLASDAVATVDYYNGLVIEIISGTGYGQVRTITAYDGSIATVAAWDVIPDNTSVYIISGKIRAVIDFASFVKILENRINSPLVRNISYRYGISLSDLSDWYTTANGFPFGELVGGGSYTTVNDSTQWNSMVIPPTTRFVEIEMVMDTIYLNA